MPFHHGSRVGGGRNGPPGAPEGSRPPMAISAAHLALSDLFLDDCRRRTTANHFRDASNLFAANVVELQHHGVRVAAIDARMGREVGPNEGAGCGLAPLARRLPLGVSLWGIAIVCVVSDLHARLAVRSPAVRLGSVTMEICERLDFLALTTGFQGWRHLHSC